MKTILTVDDSQTIRQLLGVVLKAAGYNVIEAVDGQDAISKISGKEVHLVITDVNMPNMNGMQLTELLRTKADFKFVPIVMLTTESKPEMKALGKAAGATGWIVKPFDADQLLAVVKKVMR
jgi:two-component system chemotaxis response regulator CheY